LDFRLPILDLCHPQGAVMLLIFLKDALRASFKKINNTFRALPRSEVLNRKIIQNPKSKIQNPKSKIGTVNQNIRINRKNDCCFKYIKSMLDPGKGDRP
jgi:hypothetical protein